MKNTSTADASRYKSGIRLLNNADASRISAILTRLLKTSIFTDEEQTKLQQVLNIKQPQLNDILFTLNKIIEKAGYSCWSAGSLYSWLVGEELDESVASVVSSVWGDNAKHHIQTLRTTHKHNAPSLREVKYELDLTAGSCNAVRQVEPKALLQLQLEHEGSTDQLLTLELNHTQLHNVYTHMEDIQKHLDTLQ